MNTIDLPIQDVLPDLSLALRSHDQVVLQAPPGAGKTTLVPLHLMGEAWLGHDKILMLEPRRIATRAAAQRMSDLVDEQVGQTIGYRMRLESRVSEYTKVEVMTEGVLNRMLSSDPALDGTGLVIFDEFHERSLEADLALALCLKTRELFRDSPLKILVMSATLDADRIADMINAPVISSEGKQYPVDIRYGKAREPRRRVTDDMTRVLKQAVAEHADSSILAFLPGQGEIRQLDAALRPLLKDIEVMPLYGNLSQDEQKRAIEPGQRKLVLATNIAETSLTIDGVDVVVDSGLAREPVFDAGAGMTRLHTRNISKASANQRAGRAGRIRPGVCYRMWSKSQHDALAAHGEPEILNADLTSLALQLLDWGITDPADLAWLDAPPDGAFAQALSLLQQLGAVNGEGAAAVLTTHGEQMTSLPLHPRLAHMLVCGATIGQLEAAASIGAVLSDRDPLDSWAMSDRLDVLTGKRRCPPNLHGWMSRTVKLSEQLSRQVHRTQQFDSIADDQVVGYLLASAFPDRIARKRHAGGYQLANGRSASLPGNQTSNSKWLAVAEVTGTARSQGDTIRSASELNHELFDHLLANLTQTREVIEWDTRENRFVGEERQTVGEIVLARNKLADVTTEQRTQAIIVFLQKRGLGELAFNDNARKIQARILLARTADQAYPDVSDDNLIQTLHVWLAPYLGGVTGPRQLKKLDITKLLTNLLTWPQQQQLDTWLPERMTVPSGSSHAIDYSSTPPVLAVKLQEMFGAEQTPTVMQGKLPLVIHLLSPAGRPLQVTQDLAHFWRNAYESVKKEMKGRYPKHPWPDDPMKADATAKTNRALRNQDK